MIASLGVDDVFDGVCDGVLVIASLWRLLADRGDDVGDGDLDGVLMSAASVTMIGLSIDQSRFKFKFIAEKLEVRAESWVGES